jgi:ribonuclease HI
MKNTATIYCDGSVSDNWHRENNKGGWSAIIYYFGQKFIVSGKDTSTTNNRMELMPLVECLPTILKAGINDIVIISDSQYVLRGFKCRRNKAGGGYRKKKKLANADLWLPIYKLLDEYKPKITTTWVRGHSGNINNEQCDRIANALVT